MRNIFEEMEQLERLQRQLADQDNERLAIYCNTPAGEIIAVVRIAYQNPSLIVIKGFDLNGHRHRIVGHMATIQLHINVEEDPESGKNRWTQ